MNEIKGRNTINKKKIVKNSILLYIRMLVSLLFNLYTSRIVLRALGVVDYGVYNVVGGVVLLFTLFTSPLADSTRRFLSFEIGTQNKQKLNEVLSVSILIHLCFALVVVLLTETTGYWFVTNILDIPEERLTAALWILHFSSLSILFSVLLIPYRADVIAHERMDAFAAISILEIFLKLIVAICILFITGEKLIIYGFLLSLVSLSSYLLYRWFCKVNFEEANGTRHYDKDVAKNLLSFIGWTMTGGISSTCNGQGINMLLNVFFGPAVNAARGIALQVQGAVMTFSVNIQQAINPQITISYAANNLDGMYKLVIASSKLTYLFMFTISLPLFCYAPFILQVWLGEYPQYTVEFVRVVLLLNLLEVLAGPLIIANHATGRIKKFQIIVESVSVLSLPLSYLFLRFFYSSDPVVVYYIVLVIAFLAQCVRIVLVLPNIGMKFSFYFQQAIIPLLKITLITSVLSYFLVINLKCGDLCDFVVTCIYVVICSGVTSFYIALNNSEREMARIKLLDAIKRINERISKK